MSVLERDRGGVVAEDAKEHAGEWVAVEGNRVVFSSPRADDVLDWIEEHKRNDVFVMRLRKVGAPKRRSL